MPQSKGSYEQSRQGKGGGRSSAGQKPKVTPQGKTVKRPAHKIGSKKRGKRPKKELYDSKVQQLLTCCLSRVDTPTFQMMVANREADGPSKLIDYAFNGKSIGEHIVANFGLFYQEPQRLKQAAYDILSAKAEADRQAAIEKRRQEYSPRERSQKPRTHRERYQPEAVRKTA